MFIITGGDGKEYGPVTAEQVRVWIAAGRANLDTRAKAVGSDEWRALGEYAEFSTPDVPPVIDPAQDGMLPGELASRGRRTAGAAINAFFYFLCTIPGSMAMSARLLEQYPELARGRIPGPGEIDIAAFVEASAWVWAGLLIAFLVQVALLTARGQNLGKLITGTRVVRADNGGPAGFLRAGLVRFLVPVFMIFVLNSVFLLGLLFLVVDFAFMFRDDRRTLHDLAAGTKVVTL
ncbi:MAG: RDD family protein [Opitutus sp.]